MLRATFVFSCLLAASSCSSRQEPAGPVNQYTLEGSVVRLNPQSRSATIKHGPIRDANGKQWMEPMTMDFPVRGNGEFEKLKPGQHIRATVHQRESDYDYWISAIRVDPHPPPENSK